MLSGKKTVRKFIFLCAFVYFVSYVTRINYGAVLAEMVTATGRTKSELSVALIGSFITYGGGQLISGFMGDRIHPKKLLAAGLAVTTVINLCIPVCTSVTVMAVLWCINGFAQSFMWPPLVKTMLMLLSMEDYEKKVVNVGFGSLGGTVFVYLAAPVCILIAGWKMMFLLSAVLGLIGFFVWTRCCPTFSLSYPERTVSKNSKKSGSKLFTPLLLIAIVAILLQGIVRDGVTTYMPSFISETYHLGNGVSILSGVLLPVFSLISTRLAAKLHLKLIPNLLTCSCVLFLACVGSAIPLYFFYETSPVLSIVLLTLLSAFVHGVNLMITTLLPPKLAGRDRLSTMAGMINSFAYVGSAISTYLIPMAAENHGWSATLLIWVAATIIGTAVCGIGIPLYRRKHKKIEA